MAESTWVKVRRDGTIKLKDSDGNSYTVAYENGDFSFNDELAAQVTIMDRGSIAGVRKGDDPILTGSFTVHFRQWTNGDGLSLVDVLQGTGDATAWVKAWAQIEQWNLDAELTIAGGLDNADSVATCKYCIFSWQFSEGDPDSLSVSMSVFGGVTYTGPT
jgi:hypothetical protein